ncbi:hypothetical protein CP981_14750 [Streptomyces platensis]|uniref:Uncharacterized protein n=1 Tax=Streptomyces platensis TaxID=58346 RepID=A0AAE6NHD6_STRPT|nr:hypothetical protein [Streptomyces platensis]OSY44892.1 hypothetical protein BG653_03702 [Streptomyces platensis]QEV52752.1 hypothetical protein CP981_14750 [Streptomyces platensis]
MSLSDLRNMGLSTLRDDESAGIFGGGGMSKAECTYLYNLITTGATSSHGCVPSSNYLDLYRSNCKGKGPKL